MLETAVAATLPFLDPCSVASKAATLLLAAAFVAFVAAAEVVAEAAAVVEVLAATTSALALLLGRLVGWQKPWHCHCVAGPWDCSRSGTSLTLQPLGDRKGG